MHAEPSGFETLTPLQPLNAGDAKANIRPRSFTATLHLGLASAETVWRAIEREGRCTPFQRYDWASTVVGHLLEAGAEVLVVEVTDAETLAPAMLAPFIRSRRPGRRIIEWLNCDVCDYSAPVLAAGPDWTAADALAAWTAIRSVLPPADILWVDSIPQDVSGVPNPLAMLPNAHSSMLVAFGLPLDGDAETILQRSCPPAFVRDLGKKERRLHRLGKANFVEADSPELVDAMFAALQEQRAARFRKLGRFDLLARPAVAAFYRDAAMQGLHGGPVRLVGLRVGEEWVGIQYGLLHQGRYQGLLLTMAEGIWANSSPGLLVQANVIQWARRNGLSYFDMSVGDLPYKRDIGGHRAPLFKLSEALTLRGRLILAGRERMIAGKAWLKAHPETFERLRVVRQSWRRKKTALAAMLSRRGKNPEAGTQD